MLPGLRYEIETLNPAGLPLWEERYAEALRELTRRIEVATEALLALGASRTSTPIPTP
jgi:hypothetical protein